MYQFLINVTKKTTVYTLQFTYTIIIVIIYSFSKQIKAIKHLQIAMQEAKKRKN